MRRDDVTQSENFLVFVFPKGGDGKLDPVCREAVAAVESAY